jgi:hypothetical protein
MFGMRFLLRAWHHAIRGDQQPRVAIAATVGLAALVALYVAYLIVTGHDAGGGR